jgi:hypothetical protein
MILMEPISRISHVATCLFVKQNTWNSHAASRLVVPRSSIKPSWAQRLRWLPKGRPIASRPSAQVIIFITSVGERRSGSRLRVYHPPPRDIPDTRLLAIVHFSQRSMPSPARASAAHRLARCQGSGTKAQSGPVARACHGGLIHPV